MMNFNEYQRAAKKYDLGKNEGTVLCRGFLEKAFGMAGEAGEVMEKLKKIIRDKNGICEENEKREIVKELGDVIWYVAMLADYLGVDFEEVAKGNIEKLESRKQRGKISGSGDNR